MAQPISGVATGTPDATSSINLVGRAVAGTRTFWLKRVWAYKSTQSADAISLYDATSSTTGVPASTLLRYKILSDYGIGQKEKEFPGHGLHFESGCVVAVDGTATGYSLCGGIGYED